MAQYRTISVSFWNDPYSEELSAQEKLFYIYCFTCPHINNAGIMHITPRKMAFETGINDVAPIIERFIRDGKMFMVDGYYWIRNFIKHQATTSPKIVQSIVSALQNTPQELINTISIAYPELRLQNQYPINTVLATLSIQYGEREEEVEEEREKEIEEEKEARAVEVALLPALAPHDFFVDAAPVSVQPDQSQPQQPPVIATITPPKQRKPSFFPPSKEECAEFFRNKGSTDENAGKFWYFYDAKDWMVGKSRMVNWKSAASRWLLEDSTRKPQNTNGYGTASATKADHAALNSAISANLSRMG